MPSNPTLSLGLESQNFEGRLDHLADQGLNPTGFKQRGRYRELGLNHPAFMAEGFEPIVTMRVADA